jgi:DNA-3-methyladenine glycosylase
MKQTSKKLTESFFNRDTNLVARELLGKLIYHQKDNYLYKAVISETEAYHGETDLACHCSKGKTNRTEVMYGPPGHIYVYLIYGMYHMLNFVTMPKDFPAAVLIRGVQNLQISENGQEFQPLNLKTDGPGKLTKHLKIDKTYNKLKLSPENKIWLADEGIVNPDNDIKIDKRIGIDYAKEWADKPWRYLIKKLPV